MELINKSFKTYLKKDRPEILARLRFSLLSSCISRDSHFVTKKECCQRATERHSIRRRKYLRLLSTPATRQVSVSSTILHRRSRNSNRE